MAKVNTGVRLLAYVTGLVNRELLLQNDLVGSSTGAVARRLLLGCIRGFPLRARLGSAVAPFPAPVVRKNNVQILLAMFANGS